MSDTTQTNAMAEIAFALAMGFFSIMVLTMVSMGGNINQAAAPADIALPDTPLTLGKTAPDPQQADPTQTTTAQQVSQDDLIIFSQGQYLDATLTPFDPKTSPQQTARDTPLILAVPPTLSMAETLEVRKAIAQANVTIVPLNAAWLTTLQEAGL